MTSRPARRIGALAAVLAAAAFAGGLVAAGPAGAAGRLPTRFDPDILAPGSSGRAIVGFTHDVTARTIERLADVGIAQAVRLDTIDAVGVIGPIAAYKAIARWDDVTYVDDDSPIRFANYSAKKDTHVTDVRKGKAPLRSKYTGKGVTVAVIDTGIDSTHPDLADRVVKHVNFEPAWFFDMIYDGNYSDQVAETTGNAIDSYGHGTHVAGIVAGTGAASSGADMSGVAPGASLVNIKIADVHQGLTCSVPCDFGWEINALVAYEWVIENRNDETFPGGIRIATNSWSIYEVDSEAEPITLIVAAAAKAGLVNLFAASNDGCPADGKSTVAPGPNSLEQVITVASSCKSDGCGLGNISSFSSCGPEVDVAAPGSAIWSTWARASTMTPGGVPPGDGTNALYYVDASGTSMATPHVAGIVALMLQADPKLTYQQVERILTQTAVDYGDKGFDIHWGFGQVDAFRAVVAAEGAR